MNSISLPPRNYGMANGLRSVMEIPDGFRHVFNFEYFNHIQSKVFDDAYYSDNSLVLSAPTGSGKTVLFELAIVHLLLKLDNIQQNYYKIVYIAPMKALCNEKLLEWRRVFNRLGIICESMTSDTGDVDLQHMMSIHILLTTPEKWDFISRRWRDCTTFFENVKLFMIDEIHLLNEERRGAILETIVMRMKSLQKLKTNNKKDETIRFIAASATIPNVEDIAIWLSQDKPAKYIRISDDQRPVKLDRHVLGFSSDSRVNGFRFDISLNYKLPGIIQKYSIGKPILIFCSTRKSVEMASNYLYSNLKLNLNVEQKQTLQLVIKQLRDTKLHGLLLNGIAYHHAGLVHSDRQFIENAFRNGNIPVLLCTNTLSMGVNLPAYMVIVKSTETYSQGTMKEIDESTILQMIGRAGRPQFDSSGVAIIMTQNPKVQKYENLVSGTLAIESHLHQHLAVYLNSEIAIHTIVELNVALEWLKSSFLFVRANKNPKFYGFLGISSSEVTNKLEAMCNVAINSLEHYKLIRKDGQTLVSTPRGRIMTRYYLSFQTMKILNMINGKESLQDMFNILSSFYEFSEYHLRVNEKRTLNELNNSKTKETIRFTIKGKIQTVSHKISCLMQAVFGNLNIPDSSLAQESMVLIKLAERLSRCLLDYIMASEFSNGSLQATVSAVQLAKCCKAHLWENSIYVSKQLKKIGLTYSLQLATNGFTTFKSLLETNPRRIENILKKAPPFGNEIIDSVSILPQYKVTFQKESNKSGCVMIEQINEKYKYENKSNEGVILIVGDDFNGILLYNDTVQFILSEYGTFRRSIKYRNFNISKIYIYLIHQSIVGLDEHLEYKIDNERNIAKLVPIEFSVNNKKSNQPTKKLPTQQTLTQIVSNSGISNISNNETNDNSVIDISDTSDNKNNGTAKAVSSNLSLTDWINECADIEISDTSNLSDIIISDNSDLSISEINNENTHIIISDSSDLSIECTDQPVTVIEIFDSAEHLNLTTDVSIDMEICDNSNVTSKGYNNNNKPDQSLNNNTQNRGMCNISVVNNKLINKSDLLIKDNNISSTFDNLDDDMSNNKTSFKNNNLKTKRKFVPIFKTIKNVQCSNVEANNNVSNLSTEISGSISNNIVGSETKKKKCNFDIGIKDFLAEVPKETNPIKLKSTVASSSSKTINTDETKLYDLDYIRGCKVDEKISTTKLMDEEEEGIDIYDLSVSEEIFAKIKADATNNTLGTNNLIDNTARSIVTPGINNFVPNSFGTPIQLPMIQNSISYQNQFTTTNTFRATLSAPQNFFRSQTTSSTKRLKFDQNIVEKKQTQNINFHHQINYMPTFRQPIRYMNTFPTTPRFNFNNAVYPLPSTPRSNSNNAVYSSPSTPRFNSYNAVYSLPSTSGFNSNNALYPSAITSRFNSNNIYQSTFSYTNTSYVSVDLTHPSIENALELFDESSNQNNEFHH